MPFSAALGLAGSVIGGIASMGAANAAAEAAMYDANLRRETEQDMMNLSRQQMGIGMDMLGREQQLTNYVFDQNSYNRDQTLDQMYYGRGMVDEDRRMALAERDFQIDRVRQMDGMAQQEYQRQLRAIENNTRITASERQFGIQQLEQAQRVAQQERQFQLDLLMQDRSRLESERGEAIGYLDYNRSVAQQERGFDINRYNQNRATAGGERQQALDLLTQSQQVAQQERSEDRQQFNQNSQQAAQERNFQEREYMAMRQQAMQERMDSMNRRNQIDQATGQYGQALQTALESYGQLEPIDYLGEEDIAAEAGRREQVAVDDVNSMADRVASINEANLIRGGVDQSTRATDERERVTARLSDEMAKARQGARSEAVNYVSGINDQLRLGDEMERLRRGSGLQEIAQTYGVPLEMLMRSPELQTALGGPQFSQVGSAVYDRGIQSANDYQAPINVNSGIIDQNFSSAGDYGSPLSVGSSVMDRNISSGNDYRSPVDFGSAVYNQNTQNLGYGMADFANFQSGIGPSAYGQSGAYQFSMPQISSAAALLSGANSGLSSVLNSRGQQANYSAQRAGSAAAGAGAAFTNMFQNLGGALDQWFPSGGGDSGGGGGSTTSAGSFNFDDWMANGNSSYDYTAGWG